MNTPTACIAHQPLATKGDEPFHVSCNGLFSIHDSNTQSSPFQHRLHLDACFTERNNCSSCIAPSKWLHSVFHEPDFCDEWTALNKAFTLAWEFAPLTNYCSESHSVSPTHLVRKTNSKKSVQFSDEVQLFIGLDDDQDFARLTVPWQSLCMPDKPWSLRETVVNLHVPMLQAGNSFDHSCEVHVVGNIDQANPMLHRHNFDAQCLTNRRMPRDESSAIRNVESRKNSKGHLPLLNDFKHSTKLQLISQQLPCGTHHCAKENHNLTYGRSQTFDGSHPHESMHDTISTSKRGSTKFVSPRFTTTSLQGAQCKDIQEAVCAGPHVVVCRREHESPIAEFADQLPANPQPEDIDPAEQPGNVPVPPAFVADLSNRFIRLGFDIHSGDFDVLLRTWYIDHSTIRRWTAPRFLQLAGPPHLWEEQFSSLWVDQIDPNDWFDITVIHPDPPRLLRHSHVVFDVVVTQSLHLDRFAGLVTVLPDSVTMFELFSVAASFDTHVSGFDIAQAADATQICRYRECTVTFGWQEIPFTLRRQHVTSHGDGFQLMVRHTLTGIASAATSDSQPGSSTDRVPITGLSGQSEGVGPPCSVAASSNTTRFTTPLHIFQLEGIDIVVNLVNAQIALPSHEIADALRVPFNCIEALHIMPIPPDGFPEMSIPAIVQRVGDIPLHSTDRLILIDVIYHHHQSPAGVSNRPTLVRSVHRVTHQVTRQQILFYAAVFHYCELLQEGCAVSLDGLLWPVNHVNPRPVSHGSYATVDVPPPFETTANTRAIADILHHDGTTDAFMEFMNEPMEDVDDATSLAQLYRSQMVFTRDINRWLRSNCRSVQLPPDATCCQFNTGRTNQQFQQEPVTAGSVVQVKEHMQDTTPQAPLQKSNSAKIDNCNEGDTTLDELHPEVSKVGDKSSHASVTKPSKPTQALSQMSLHSFFMSKKPTKTAESQVTRAGSQTKIADFFVRRNSAASVVQSPISAPVNKRDIPHASDWPSQTSQEVIFHHAECGAVDLSTCTDNLDAKPEDPIVSFRCSSQQEADPPVLTTSTAPNLNPVPPERAPTPAWRLHLFNLFQELATIDRPGDEPTMQVEVWYVHHDLHPECLAPRVVALDPVQQLWYADLCNAWLDRIQRHQPMRVVNVLPNPPHHTRPGTAVHIILEQGLTPEKVAIHFTARFLGGTRLGLFQRAESTPARLCTRDMIIRHGFQLQCDYRPCDMHSGIMRFSRYDPEEIFSGICVVLTVAPPPSEPVGMPSNPQAIRLTSDHMESDDDHMSNMQVQPPQRPAPQSGAANSAQSLQPFNHRMTPAALTEFRATLQWQFSSLGQTCHAQDAIPVQVQTWYLHSDSRIRSEEFRFVWIGQHPHTWHQEIIDAWRDVLDVDQPIHLHVVMPNPTSADLEKRVHVIVLQKPNPLWRAAILTLAYPRENPWHITMLCVMLDAQTDIGQISFISGATHPSNPRAASTHVEVTHGGVQLPPEGTFPVRDGFWFSVSAFVRGDNPWDDAVSLIQTQFSVIRTKIAGLIDSVSALPKQHMLPENTQASEAPGPNPLSVSVFPNDPQAFSDPCDALSFFTHLQACWQPLALLQPPALTILVPIVTWYIDHVRFPQCFQPRYVLLNNNPADWIQRIRSAWNDLVLPQSQMYVHVVQPAPPEMPMHVAAHIIIVQQPIATFRSVLITSIDSANPPGSATSHATMAPTPLAYQTVLALAYHEGVCQQPQNDCAAWVGETELTQADPLPVVDGHSVVLALHRHHLPLPDTGDPWEHSRPTQQPVYVPHHDSSHWRHHSLPNRAQVPCEGFPVVLSLDAVIPAVRPSPQQEWDETLSAIASSASVNWHHRITASLDVTLLPLPSSLCLTHATLNVFFEAMEATIGPYELIELYVDGATNAVAAAWSLVAVVHSGGSPRLLGTLAGPVVIATQSHCWIGATSLDNIAAELSALAAALATSLMFHFPCPVYIRPDLSLSRLIAQELVTTKSNPILARVCRALAQWIDPNVGFLEVRGHTNNAWNDLADSLAKHVLQYPDDFQPIPFGDLHSLAREPHDLDWTWIKAAPASLRHCFPDEVDSTVWQFSPSQRTVQPLQCQQEQHQHPIAFHCSATSINVLALDRTDTQVAIGRRKGARTLRLDHQLHAAGFHIAGLQETRTVQGRMKTDHYHIFASGGDGPDASRFGCELWVHCSLPLMVTPQGVKVTLADCAPVIAHADPRRLYVRLEHDAIKLAAVVLHAPCLGKATGDGTRPIDHIRDWWKETARLWHHAVTTDMVCVFVDANATLATSPTEFFQLHGADATTAQSQVFEEFLIEKHLYVPATFAALHSGPSYTWTHSSGHRMRLDYVLVSHSLFQMTSQSATWTSYDGTFTHEDHIPAVLHLSGWMSPPSVKPKHRWDDLALLDPSRCAAFRDALATLPMPAWEISIDSHAAIFETQMHQLAKQFFTKKRGARQRPTLSAPTLDAIAFKRHVLDCGRAWSLMTDPEFKEQLKSIEVQVKRMVTADLQVFFDQLLVHLQDAGQLSDHKQMFRILARLGSRRHKHGCKARPLPMLKAPDGSAVTTYQQQQQLWLRQFAKIEAGLPVSWDDLSQADATCPPLAFDIHDPSAFPADWNIQAAVSRFKRGKAPGPNGLTPCILKAGGGVLSKQFTALTTKIAAHGKEPTSWKGGKLVPLYKGKESTFDPASYRAIYISDYTSKLYHRMLRSQLEIPWSSKMDLLQLGGRKAMGTDLAHHLLETHQFLCRKSKLPSAIVYFDLRAAFYSVLRQALPEGNVDASHVQQALTQWGVEPQVIHLWLQQAAQDHALLDASAHTERLIQDCMSHTFFTIEGVTDVCQTTRGTRPGDPLGDLLFNLIMRLVLQDMHRTLRGTTTAAWIGQPDSCRSFADAETIPLHAYFDVSFVDDAAVAIHAPTLAEVEHCIMQVVQAFHHATRIRGLDVNFSKGKTEVLWDVIGKGSKALKERLHDAGQWLQWEHEGHQFALKVTHTYKHLGSWMQVGGSHQKETTYRAGQALQSWGCLARTFYHKKHVGMKAKSLAFQSLSMSRLLYNAHTWTGITDDTVAHWQQKLRKPLGLMTRSMLKGISPFKVDTLDLFALAGLLPPSDQIHIARLRYMKRLLAYCPQTLWNLLFHSRRWPTNWLGLCESSFAWFLQFYPVPGAPLDKQDLAAWMSYIALDPNWKGRLKRAAKGCLLFRQATAEQQVWLKGFQSQFQAAGGILPCNATQPAERWICDQCSKAFPSKRALATHAGRAHGYRRLVKYYAVDQTCNACAKTYATRKRLIEHLRDAKECLQTLQACYPPLSDEQVVAMDTADHQVTLELRANGWGAAKALAPPRKIHGPCLPSSNSQDAADMKAKWTARSPNAGSGFTQLQGHTAAGDEGPEPQVRLFAEDMPAFVFQSAAGLNSGDGRFCLRGLARECARLHIRAQVFVHFFSGFRRKADIHDLIEHHVFPNGHQVFVISVDMCLQRERGDLATSASLTWWMDRIKSGLVCGAGGGPPCETYSAARLLPGAPPPVRSGTWPDGIPSNTAKAWRQVIIGSRLMRFILDVFLLLAVSGGCAFVEHPQFPTWAVALDPSSIWSSLPMRLLKTIAAVGVTSFDQCIFGCRAKKPTTIIHLRLPKLRQTILTSGAMGRCCHGAGSHEALAGQEVTGAFKTARGKIYPHGLNMAIATAVADYVQSTFDPSKGQQLPADFSDLVANEFVDEDQVQPDYYG